jgi:segregation and condensation protein B
MAFNLKKVLKAWLLSSSEPLSLKDIQATFTRFHEQVSAAAEPAESAEAGAPAEALAAVPVPSEEAELPAETVEDPELYQDVPSLVTAAQIRETMDDIATELKVADDGLVLIEGADGYRLLTHPRFGRWIRLLRQEPPPVKLSQSSLETLAVVAYRQPVTRAEIETIRGVAAEAGVTKLIERELIAIVGRADLPGRPIQYGTTEKCLEFLGIKSLDELPASDVLSSRQIDEWLRNSANPPKPGDSDMGLADEELPLGHTGRASAPPESATSASSGSSVSALAGSTVSGRISASTVEIDPTAEIGSGSENGPGSEDRPGSERGPGANSGPASEGALGSEKAPGSDAVAESAVVPKSGTASITETAPAPSQA